MMNSGERSGAVFKGQNSTVIALGVIGREEICTVRIERILDTERCMHESTESMK